MRRSLLDRHDIVDPDFLRIIDTKVRKRAIALRVKLLLISDDKGPESIAGVMGGEETGCTDETVNVFLESAYWDPVTIANTGRALKINSDAKYRFERGVDPEFTLPGLEAATAMVWSFAEVRRRKSFRLGLCRTRRGLIG